MPEQEIIDIIEQLDERLSAGLYHCIGLPLDNYPHDYGCERYFNCSHHDRCPGRLHFDELKTHS